MKKSMFSIQQWEEIVNQYQCFNGTMNQFCQTKGITKAQLYYYRKKFNNQNQDSTEFCQVTLESTKVTKSYPDTNVTFEIGENTIIVLSIEKDLIIKIIKELATLC
ncbi:IS66 family insertion sequence element accessory protein TnpA [Intestinibacter bartlettii]|uniref:IS66 family insertion sequence element accessory protein TnpA n=1 Tax=Intestinibacter bartlettii TaxID=261299 RepID=UPI00399515E0